MTHKKTNGENGEETNAIKLTFEVFYVHFLWFTRIFLQNKVLQSSQGRFPYFTR